MILDLQRAAKEGNEAAIIAVVGQHREQVRRMAWKLNRGRYLAEDLESEGVIGIMEAIKYNDVSKGLDLGPLVGRFARFRMFAVLRKLANRQARERLFEDMEDGDPCKEPVHTLSPDKMAMLLEECPKKLRRAQMRAYYRRHWLRLRKYKAVYRDKNREALRSAERERYRRNRR